ncbi:MAG: ANTAR domain-containing protein [Ruminococcus sp.]|nr:ANTAR domain-containing protein [Ruminococcus sp.]
MQSILIVSSNEKTAALVLPLIKEMWGECKISVCDRADRALGIARESNVDIVIINSPLGGVSGSALAVDICKKTNAGCIVITAKDHLDELSSRLEEQGVLVLGRPISKQMFVRSLRLLSASRNRFLGLEKENIKLHRELDEIKMINRAKSVLMKYLKFSEEQAHRYIEKQSMDLRMSKYDIALKVVKTYDLDA